MPPPPVPARRAYEIGMVDRITPRDQLEVRATESALRVAEMPRLGLALTKRAANQAEDLQGPHSGMAVAAVRRQSGGRPPYPRKAGA